MRVPDFFVCLFVSVYDDNSSCTCVYVGVCVMGVRPTSNFERPSQKKKSGKLVFWSDLKLSIALQWGHGCPEEFVSAACNSPPHTMVSTLTSTYEFQACLPNPKELEDGLHKGSANRPTRSLRNTHPHIPCSACSSMIMITPRYVRPVRCFLCSSSLLLPITLFRTPPPQSFFILPLPLLQASSSSSFLSGGQRQLPTKSAPTWKPNTAHVPSNGKTQLQMDVHGLAPVKWYCTRCLRAHQRVSP